MHPKKIPSAVFADEKGTITDFPDLLMAGMSCGEFSIPKLTDIIPLPEGSELFTLPGRIPIAWEEQGDEPVLLANNPYAENETTQAVAAFMSPANTAIFTAAYQSNEDAPTLPLFAYTAVGWLDGCFWVTAFRSDLDTRQDCNNFDQETINKNTLAKLKQYPNNRLIQHLGKCCLTYGCPAARNYFLNRWEAPLPTSPTCNARCLGCISLQESGCCPSTQDRLSFVPTPKEISDMAVAHIITADRPIVSFGQGCEGEPLMEADTLEKAIVAIRKQTTKGTINLNSNASLPHSVANLALAGLDSMRVSINSAQEQYYNPYYRPKGFTFDDVMQSIDEMKKAGKFVSINYFILPGLTDSPEEFAAFCKLIELHKPDFIQLRNLNMDPEWYLKEINFKPISKALGMRNWLHSVKEKFPELKFGYFNPYLGN
ncbi:MAG: radical SAM protein [Desulfotalea sp.]